MRETPTRTRSASCRPRGSLPSSYLMAKSMASIRLKYFSSRSCNRPVSKRGWTLRARERVSIRLPSKSTVGMEWRAASASSASRRAGSTMV
ncbi:hypothetical protein D3C87_1992720 [compost metagenome]